MDYREAVTIVQALLTVSQKHEAEKVSATSELDALNQEIADKRQILVETGDQITFARDVQAKEKKTADDLLAKVSALDAREKELRRSIEAVNAELTPLKGELDALKSITKK